MAGIGAMAYSKFILYNICGGIAWVCLFLMGGYFFGNIPVVKANFEYVVVVIVLVSLLPMAIEWWKGKKK